MLVLDTRSLPVADRADAFQASVSQNCSTSMASFDDAAAFNAELHVYDFGPAKVFNIDAAGTTLRRTPRMASGINECSIVLALPVRATNRLLWSGEDRFFGPRDMMLVDVSAPYVYGWHGDGASYAFHVDIDQLGLPMDTIRAATTQLHTSPLYPLVRNHIVQLTTQAERLAESGAASELGAASALLMHALVVSAAHDQRHLGDALHASRAARVQTYVRHHLRDPDLDATTIAAANGLSVRALYQLYEQLGTSLEQSIIQQRLEGARDALAARRQAFDSIAATARAWGFTNPSHFSARFRRAFGVTPRQWRNGLRPDPGEPASG